MATALESASLVMAPCGYEDGTLGSLQPTDGSGDFTFTRGSNLSATRVNAAGNIEKGYENLLLQSNSFDTTWVTAATSVTSNQAGYDGFNDAWKLETTSNGSRYLQQLISVNSVQSISIYAKSGTTDFLGIQIIGTGSGYSFFNLSNGTLGSSSSGVIDKNIELVNGTTDWYKCSFVINANTVAIRIYPTNADSVFPSTTGQNIYIQDAMLNQGLVAYPYIETTTTSAQGGILEDTPRIDYSSGPNGSLLLEPSRTNLINNSGYFANRVYNSTIITQNYNISPEGVINSALIDKNGVAYGRIDYNFYYPSGTYTYSAFVKGNDIVKLRLDYPGSSKEAYINCSNGQTTNYQSKPMDSISSVNYGNGWYRFICTAETPSGLTLHVARLYVMDVIGGEGNSNPATAEIYGTQVEQGSYPTSYIPTYGTSVTRAREVCGSAGNSSTFNSTEGVLYAEIARLDGDTGGYKELSISDGTTSNVIKITLPNSNFIQGAVRTNISGTVLETLISYTPIGGYQGFQKIALKYKQNDFALFVNGIKVGFNTNGNTCLSNVINNFSFNRGNPVNIFYGKAKQVLTFNTALSDAALIELTTL